MDPEHLDEPIPFSLTVKGVITSIQLADLKLFTDGESE
jgi:hypothetical protein